MGLLSLLSCKPRTLGAGLNRIKRQFGVKGENTSTIPGTRNYPCYGNKHTLNIRTDGKPYDSCLCLEVDRYKEPQNTSLLGKISDITKSYTRKHVYQDGDIGTYNEHYTTVDKFVKTEQGQIERVPSYCYVKGKVIEPWVFNNRIVY